MSRQSYDTMFRAALADGAILDEGTHWVIAEWHKYQIDRTGAERKRIQREKQVDVTTVTASHACHDDGTGRDGTGHKQQQLAATPPDESSKSSPRGGGATTQKPGAGSTEAPPRQPIWTRQRSPPPKSDVAGFLVWELAVEAEKTLNQAYPPMWGRDKRLLKPRLKQLGREEIQRRWQNFLKECQTDEFRAKHNEIKDFCSNINGYANQPRKTRGRVQARGGKYEELQEKTTARGGASSRSSA